MRAPRYTSAAIISAALVLVGALFSTACASTNVALGKSATANATYSTAYPSRAVDGDLNTQWSAPSHATQASPYYLEVDLGAIYSLDRIVLTGPSSSYVGYTNMFNVYLAADYSNWNCVGSGVLVDTTEPVETLTFVPTNARYIKYEVVGGSHWAGLYELEAYAVPEPSSLMVLVGGLGSLLALKRRRA